MQIAKALVLAGSGPQNRPWPSVRSMPKALVPVANRPILFHNLEALRRAGLLEATIAVDPETASAIRGAVGDGSDWDLTIRYLDCATDMRLGAALATARDFISDEPVLVQHAGALMRERIQPHIAAFADERLDALTLRLRPYPRAGSEGEAVDGGWMLSERAVAMLAGGDGTSADPIAYIREQGGQARVQDVDGCLSCHGDQDMLLEANRRMLEDIVPDFDPASVQGSELQGPVIVHPTARVETQPGPRPRDHRAPRPRAGRLHRSLLGDRRRRGDRGHRDRALDRLPGRRAALRRHPPGDEHHRQGGARRALLRRSQRLATVHRRWRGGSALMTPTQGTSRMQTSSKGGKVERTPRCEHTMLTKPECHCQACLMAQIAAHGSLSTAA